MERFCRNCDVTFTTNYKWQRFCSDSCRIRFHWPEKTNIPCSHCNKTTRNKNGVCSVCASKKDPEWNPKKCKCLTCGNKFIQGKNQPRQKYCSKECLDRRKRTRPSDYQLKYRIKNGWKPKIKCIEKIPTFKTKINYILSENGLIIKESSENQSKDEIKLLLLKATNNPHSCKNCGVFYSAINFRGGAVFCSSECSNQYHKRIAKSKRKAVKIGGEVFDPFDVFEKHKWKCNNCGVDTPKKLRGKHLDNSPELDHVIPISKGGSHTLDNVQLLCRKCNGKKSDKIFKKNETF